MERRISRQKIYQQLTDILLEDIKKGIYAVGEQLPSERELMDMYEVGRPAVREALSKLALMGLIDLKPGVRARVRQPTLSRLLQDMYAPVRLLLATSAGVRHFQEVRMLIETGLARKAAQSCTDEQISRLAEALEENEAAIDNREHFAATDLRFHTLLAEFTGNPLLNSMIEIMGEWLKEQRATTLSGRDQPQASYEAHAAIFEAIRRHDPEEAEQAMYLHLNQVQKTWEEVEQQ